MHTELKTAWVRPFEGEAPQEVAALIDDGWELVNWQPVAVPPVERSGGRSSAPQRADRAALFDVFLLKRTVPDCQ